jgi:hypothetical protein
MYSGKTSSNYPDDVWLSSGKIQKMNKAYIGNYHSIEDIVANLTCYDVITMSDDTADAQSTMVKIRQTGWTGTYLSYEYPWGYGPSADAETPHPVEWAEINTYEQWFLHTDDGAIPGSGTQRISLSGSDYFLMNIAPGSGWITAFKQILQWTTLPENGAADGWHFDCCMAKEELRNEAPSITNEIYNNWEYWVLNMLHDFQTTFPHKLVSPNISNYKPYVDGIRGQPGVTAIQTELFIHPTWQPYDYNNPGYSEETCLEHMNFVKKYSELGVRIRVTDGCYMTYFWQDHTTPTKDEATKIHNIFRLSLACFLLVNSLTYWNRSCFAFNKLRETPYNGYYGPEMDYNWGTPRNDFYAVPGTNGEKGLYARDFANSPQFGNYTIYANIDTSHSFTVKINGQKVTIPPRGAWFPSD